jgi:lipopolysaccharide/colanic/teichoic acid biosynthesis glycosyltransferase
MHLSQFWQYFNSSSRTKEARTLDSLLSVQQFRSALERERARTDRTGRQFSLAVFQRNGTGDGLAQRFEDLCRKRLRLIDEVGLLDTNQIGVVLPETDGRGAWRIAEDVCKGVGLDAQPPFCRIYTYPSEWPSGFHGNRPNLPPTKGSSGKPTVSQRSSECFDMNAMKKQEQGLEEFLIYPSPLWKRGFDIFGSVVGLVLLFPLFFFIAIFIKIVSPGPIFFKQQRVGRGGKLFTCWKFRTMHVDIDTSPHEQYFKELTRTKKPMTKLDMDEDPRIIPLGNLLRQSGLDELPQLINVLRGEMSLIGPRPPITYEVREYESWHKKRFDTMPGLTGLWQVSGKNRTTFNEMIRLDITYGEKISLWSEARIFLKTFPALAAQITDYLLARRSKGHEKTM